MDHEYTSKDELEMDGGVEEDTDEADGDDDDSDDDADDTFDDSDSM